MSGASTPIWRSKRPGRSSAGSSTSGRLVAAMRMTLVLASKPSISTSSWLRVCSRSSLPPPMPAPRWRPTASISSTKMMAGALSLACSNRSRTREAPTPTNISTKSEPEIEKKGTPASPATALRQQGLAGAGRAVEQHALGDLRADGGGTRRLHQELLDLVELLHGLVRAGDVGEGHRGVVLVEHLGPRAAEAHDLGAAALRPGEHEPEDGAAMIRNGSMKPRRLVNQFDSTGWSVNPWRSAAFIASTTSSPRGVT